MFVDGNLPGTNKYLTGEGELRARGKDLPNRLKKGHRSSSVHFAESCSRICMCDPRVSETRKCGLTVTIKACHLDRKTTTTKNKSAPSRSIQTRARADTRKLRNLLAPGTEHRNPSLYCTMHPACTGLEHHLPNKKPWLIRHCFTGGHKCWDSVA